MVNSAYLTYFCFLLEMNSIHVKIAMFEPYKYNNKGIWKCKVVIIVEHPGN